MRIIHWFEKQLRQKWNNYYDMEQILCEVHDPWLKFFFSFSAGLLHNKTPKRFQSNLLRHATVQKRGFSSGKKWSPNVCLLRSFSPFRKEMAGRINTQFSQKTAGRIKCVGGKDLALGPQVADPWSRALLTWLPCLVGYIDLFSFQFGLSFSGLVKEPSLVLWMEWNY